MRFWRDVGEAMTMAFFDQYLRDFLVVLDWPDHR